MITPGPKWPKHRVTHSAIRQYYEFVVLDGHRVLSAEQLAELADRYPDARLSPTRMVWDFDPEDDETEHPGWLIDDGKRDKLLCSYFDAHLAFHACGDRLLMFRLPTSRLDLAAVRPYLARRLEAHEHGSDLLLGFVHDEADGEFTHWREQPKPAEAAAAAACGPSTPASLCDLIR